MILNKLSGWKKILAVTVGFVLNAAGPQLGLSPDAIDNLTQVLMAYLVGQGIADMKK